jgi:hypothetical protein
MIAIDASARLPLATLLFLALLLVALACVLLRRTPSGTRWRAVTSAAIVGVLLAGGSSALESRRHAGTGTETARGWPRAVHTRWESFDTPERRSGVDVRGLGESALFYAAVVAAVLAGAATVRGRAPDTRDRVRRTGGVYVDRGEDGARRGR